MPAPFRDRIVLWPSAVAFASPMALILVWSGSFDLAFFGAPLVLLLWSSVGACGLFLVVVWLIAQRWRLALAMAVVPLTTLAAFLNLGFVWAAAIWTGDHLHLWVMRPFYLAEIERLPTERGPRLATFDWGGWASVSHGVVYDESDEILRAPERRSDAWKRRAADTEISCGVWGSSAGGHFYIVRFGC